MATTTVEFDKDKAAEYDAHPMAKAFPPVFRRLLDSWEWYKSPSPLRVLDFGSGTGLNTFEFAQHGHMVTAADVSPHMLAILRNKLESLQQYKDSITLVQVSPPKDVAWLNALSTSDPFDVIFVVWVLHHISADQQQVVISSLSKLLKVGGRICVLDFEDTERSRAVRGSVKHGHHHHNHDHGHDHHHHHQTEDVAHRHEHNHHGDSHKSHSTDHEHHHHDHKQDHGSASAEAPLESQKVATELHWMSRDTLTTYLQKNGLTTSQSEQFHVTFDDENTMDCYYMIGQRL